MSVDVYFDDDLDVSGRIATGGRERLQRLEGRVTTGRGGLLADGSYGLIAAAYLGQPEDREMLRADIQAEVQREPDAIDAEVEIIDDVTIQISIDDVVEIINLAPADAIRFGPDIFTVAPATGSASGSAVVDISGEYFDNVLGVYFDDLPVQFWTRIDSSRLRIITAVHLAGAVEVRVETLGGVAQISGAYTYL
jgi:IPT/TIG domain